jgi:hypothetical protein
MNWRFPNGHIVRIGERVAKTTTGYDLFRFLLSSGQRFGQPIDYVLRLRPDCGVTSIHWLSGSADRIAGSIPVILKNCWMHWFDSIDVIVKLGDQCQARIVVNCPEDECRVVDAFLTSFAVTHELTVETERDTSPPTDGLPDLVLKTSPEFVLQLANQIARTGGLHCVALCYNGVVHVYLNDDSDKAGRISKLVQKNAMDLQSIGGDWHSRHIREQEISALEAGWVSIFEQESNIK